MLMIIDLVSRFQAPPGHVNACPEDITWDVVHWVEQCVYIYMWVAWSSVHRYGGRDLLAPCSMRIWQHSFVSITYLHHCNIVHSKVRGRK